MEEISPQILKEKMNKGEKFCLVDVRLPEETSICTISESLLIPLHELDQHFDHIPKNIPIVTVCHHGIRSQRAALLLLSAGFKNVYSLKGGVHAWSQTIDPTMPIY